MILARYLIRQNPCAFCGAGTKVVELLARPAEDRSFQPPQKFSFRYVQEIRHALFNLVVGRHLARADCVAG
jgi:hypothetical protein